MQLTQFTDYSLRTLMFLGAHPGRLCKIAQIAVAYGISINHLMKVSTDCPHAAMWRRFAARAAACAWRARRG